MWPRSPPTSCASSISALGCWRPSESPRAAGVPPGAVVVWAGWVALGQLWTR